MNLKTLNFIKEILNDLRILSAKSGKKIYDWRIPSEWKIKDAYIEGEDGKKFVNLKKITCTLLVIQNLLIKFFH